MTARCNRSRRGSPFYSSASKCLIVPVGIAGAYDAWPRWRQVPDPEPNFLDAEWTINRRGLWPAARSERSCCVFLARRCWQYSPTTSPNL